MRTLSWVTIPIIGLAALACRSAERQGLDPALTDFEPGRYRYTATTDAGDPLLTGWLEVVQIRDPVGEDDTTDAGGACCDWVIEGSWTIDWAPGADRSVQVGPQIGAGRLRGAFVPDGIVLEFNPDYADNNTGVFGPWTEAGLDGRWEWNTITGPRSGGPATLTREK